MHRVILSAGTRYFGIHREAETLFSIPVYLFRERIGDQELATYLFHDVQSYGKREIHKATAATFMLARSVGRQPGDLDCRDVAIMIVSIAGFEKVLRPICRCDKCNERHRFARHHSDICN